LRIRLAHAHQRLLHGHEPVADIALQSGFVNRSHFANSFRLAFGMTPSAMRASQGAAQAGGD
jgi:AraC family transcriptional regulator